MADLFADIESTIDVPFNNGVVVTMRKYSDAGIQEDLEAESSRMRMHQGEDEAPVDDEDADSYVYLQVQDANVRLLQKMILSITQEDGTVEHGPFSLRLIKSLTRHAFVALIDIVYENNPLYQ